MGSQTRPDTREQGGREGGRGNTGGRLRTGRWQVGQARELTSEAGLGRRKRNRCPPGSEGLQKGLNRVWARARPRRPESTWVLRAAPWQRLQPGGQQARAEGPSDCPAPAGTSCPPRPPRAAGARGLRRAPCARPRNAFRPKAR